MVVNIKITKFDRLAVYGANGSNLTETEVQYMFKLGLSKRMSLEGKVGIL